MDPYAFPDDPLRAVEAWGIGYEVVREFKLSETLRVDALLVPTSWAVVQGHGRSWPRDVPSWARMGLLAVEVKRSRADFLAGLRRAQYTDYMAAPGIMGLYLATPRGVVQRGELPRGVGHLVCCVRRGDPAAACIARPIYRCEQATPEALWRLMFRLKEKYAAGVRAAECNQGAYRERFGTIAAGTISRLGRELARLAAIGVEG